jgi:hypothetical protein
MVGPLRRRAAETLRALEPETSETGKKKAHARG